MNLFTVLFGLLLGSHAPSTSVRPFWSEGSSWLLIETVVTADSTVTLDTVGVTDDLRGVFLKQTAHPAAGSPDSIWKHRWLVSLDSLVANKNSAKSLYITRVYANEYLDYDWFSEQGVIECAGFLNGGFTFRPPHKRADPEYARQQILGILGDSLGHWRVLERAAPQWDVLPPKEWAFPGFTEDGGYAFLLWTAKDSVFAYRRHIVIASSSDSLEVGQTVYSVWRQGTQLVYDGLDATTSLWPSAQNRVLPIKFADSLNECPHDPKPKADVLWVRGSLELPYYSDYGILFSWYDTAATKGYMDFYVPLDSLDSLMKRPLHVGLQKVPVHSWQPILRWSGAQLEIESASRLEVQVVGLTGQILSQTMGSGVLRLNVPRTAPFVVRWRGKQGSGYRLLPVAPSAK